MLRGVAALLVILEHLSPLNISRLLPPGEIGVSIFFFISGYIMTYTFKKNERGFDFLKKRIKRIYPTYLILSLPILILSFINTKSLTYLAHNIAIIPFFQWDDTHRIQFNTDLSQANPVSWTLYYEMYFYIMFSLMKVFFKKKEAVVTGTSIFIISILLSTSLFHENHRLGWENLSLLNIISSLSVISFIAGMLYSLKENKNIIKNYKKTPFLIIFVSGLIIHGVYYAKFDVSPQLLDLLFSSIPSWLSCILLIKSKDLSGKIIKSIYKVGLISYSLYIFHANLYIIKNYFNLNLISGIFYMMISIAISIYVASLSFKYIESGKIFNAKIKFSKVKKINTMD